MSTIAIILLADYIVTAELEGDRLVYGAQRVTRTCSDRGDNAEIGRLRRSALCTVHLLQCIFFNTILDWQLVMRVRKVLRLLQFAAIARCYLQGNVDIGSDENTNKSEDC